MKILHTADWHIGQLFYEYDRTYEHQYFLDWLIDTMHNQCVDVLLISGDIFDLSNPSAASVKMFYSFLNRVVQAIPHIQIIVTAGNHDSAARLEAPKPLLESTNIHIVGMIEKDENAKIVADKLVIPLKDKAGNIKIWCIAVPFLRLGDFPAMPDCDNPYAEGVTALYKEVYEYAISKIQVGQTIIAMGHLYAQEAEITDMDKNERLIMGGVECISAASFHEDIKYVALGHIHKAQRIGGKEHIRYCGSPLPMSFSELNYKHQVLVFDLDGGNINNLTPIEVPIAVSLQRVPVAHSALPDVLSALQQLPVTGIYPELAPYLEVRVLLDGPEPALRHKIETALTGKHVRLAKIDSRYPAASADANDEEVRQNRLQELQPKDVFSRAYQSRYSNAVPAGIQQLFNQVAQEVAQTETV